MVAVPMLLAAVLGGIYLAFDPPSADLAAQTFRADFFDAHGFAVWSNSWYSGVHLPGYSLLYPPLGAWLGHHGWAAFGVAPLGVYGFWIGLVTALFAAAASQLWLLQKVARERLQPVR